MTKKDCASSVQWCNRINGLLGGNLCEVELFAKLIIRGPDILASVKMDGPVTNNGNANSRRGTATEFSYMLQREVKFL